MERIATYEVEAINISFLYPGLQPVGYLSWVSNKHWPIATNTDVFSDSMLGPF